MTSTDGALDVDCEAVVVNGIRQNCNAGVWDNAFLHADSEALESPLAEDDPPEVYAHGADWGARWMAAIIGIGEAIQAADRARVLEADCENHDCTCPGSWGEEYCNCNAGLYLASEPSSNTEGTK